MEAGKLNRNITFQENQKAADSDGYSADAWVDVFTRSAQKITTGGREFYAAQKLYAETTAVYILRFTRAINRNMRIKDGTQYYEIIAPPNYVDGKRKELQIIAKELV